MKIGIHGGSFNPVHKGHIAVCHEFIKLLDLDRLLLIPVNTPPHKLAAGLASNEDRYNMACLAAEDEDKIEVSDIELKRKGKSYTIDTVKQLEKLYPDSALYLIMGADMFVTLHEWRENEELLKKCVVCTTERNDIGKNDLLRYAEQTGMDMNKVIIAPMIKINISSTDVRSRIRDGLDTKDMLDRKVENYIMQRHLYK